MAAMAKRWIWAVALVGWGAAYLACDGDETHVLVWGCYEDTGDFGGGPHTSHGQTDAFLVKLTP